MVQRKGERNCKKPLRHQKKALNSLYISVDNQKISIKNLEQTLEKKTERTVSKQTGKGWRAKKRMFLTYRGVSYWLFWSCR